MAPMGAAENPSAASAAASVAKEEVPAAEMAEAAGGDAAVVKGEGKEEAAVASSEGAAAKAAAGEVQRGVSGAPDASVNDSKGSSFSAHCCGGSSSDKAPSCCAGDAAEGGSKESINYAERYLKAMGMSSSSSNGASATCRGFDLAAAAAARDLPPDDTRRAAAAAALEGKTISEVAQAKTAKVVVAAFGDATSECVRLTSQVFVSPFQVLLLTPDATEEDIRRQYRKLSLLIHPDKCKHELAQEAFQVVNKAYEKVQEEGVRQRYEGVIEEAKKRVLKQRVQENKARRAAGQELLPETLDALRGAVFECCEALLKEIQEKKDYADKCKAANEKYEREKEDKLIEEEKEKCRERNEWVKKRDERVGSWREYQEGLKKKEIDHRAFTGLRHVREERRDEDLVKKRQKVQGIDNSYKLNWR
ncbi:putative DnaJ domain-containing protein [Cyclospora cayetanensis]|uniref:DnaJ domain-containing protein n=1 Tax=Cyclospora cayetanensis TaxID=88456 RepID=A0A1D3D4X7_9EIME|nr:putative DnaJ domain-containing protein [Cyclospora cayetanensis]